MTDSRPPLSTPEAAPETPRSADLAPARTLATAPPPGPGNKPTEIAAYVRSAMHQDRKPGNVLVVLHPLRAWKLPRGLFSALRAAGYHLEIVETHPDRVQSVTRIRDAFLRLRPVGPAAGEQPAVGNPAEAPRSEVLPLDVLVVSGDGSLDHHVLVAAFWAFCPDLVRYRDGALTVTDAAYDQLPPTVRAAFFDPRPAEFRLEADEATVKSAWVLRARLEGALRANKSPSAILKLTGKESNDPLLQLALLMHFAPEHTTVRPHGFDLAGLAAASQERGFQGLYPFIRSIACYPAGTAADNALYAGVPGWTYAQAARIFLKLPFLDGLRQSMEARAIKAFLAYFTAESVVVPARFSLVSFAGDWQLISTHAAGGPAGGGFFSADLERKTGGLLGYLARIPQVLWNEAVFGNTRVRLRAYTEDDEVKAAYDGAMAEGLYTNRTFIAGVGSVPSTNPTSFAGRSTLMVLSPLFRKNSKGRRVIDIRGVGTFFEGIAKGLLGRGLHLLGFSVGTLAGGGKFASSLPDNQITLQEGESVDLTFQTRSGEAKVVAVQVSGDPLQTWRLGIRVAWGPIPLLARRSSLLLAAARRTLSDLRIEQSFHLQTRYIGGLRYFRHLVGQDWTPEFATQTGLVNPPRSLPWLMASAQRTLLQRWKAAGGGEFVDTSNPGWGLVGNHGRYAHSDDQRRHLILVQEDRTTLLARQVQVGADGTVYENRTTYRAFGPVWIIHQGQTRATPPGEAPRLLQEEHYFRTAEAVQHLAPTFFGVDQAGAAPDATAPDATEGEGGF